jgi:hypothetical protein
MNYEQLFETIKGYVENDFPNTTWTDSTGSQATYTQKEQIDTFIRQAEQRISNSVQLPAFRKNVTGNVTISNKYLSIPTDWLASFSLSVIHPVTGIQTFLLNKDVEFIRESFPPPDTLGTPQYYAVFDNNAFIVGPTPDANYGMELHYFAYPTSIVTAGTSWLGDNFDSVLLYGSLLEAYTFMKGETDVITNYEKRYNEAIGLLKQLSDGKNRRDTYRNVQVRDRVV